MLLRLRSNRMWQGDCTLFMSRMVSALELTANLSVFAWHPSRVRRSSCGGPARPARDASRQWRDREIHDSVACATWRSQERGLCGWSRRPAPAFVRNCVARHRALPAGRACGSSTSVWKPLPLVPRQGWPVGGRVQIRLAAGGRPAGSGHPPAGMERVHQQTPRPRRGGGNALAPRRLVQGRPVTPRRQARPPRLSHPFQGALTACRHRWPLAVSQISRGVLSTVYRTRCDSPGPNAGPLAFGLRIAVARTFGLTASRLAGSGSRPSQRRSAMRVPCGMHLGLEPA